VAALICVDRKIRRSKEQADLVCVPPQLFSFFTEYCMMATSAERRKEFHAAQQKEKNSANFRSLC
jgi:hypothetical protein